MMMRIGVSAAVLALAAGAAMAAGQGEDFDRDRQAILSMAGEFKVVFDFKETLALDSTRGASEPHHSEARELVKVIEDRGDFISMQHLLVVGEGEKVHIVKHWRQDWAYESPRELEFRGKDTWEWTPLRRSDRKGTWTQTVFQVGDSPRYAGTGRWIHVEPGYSYWESGETWRPLPRRESKRRKDYDVLVGRNRHSITPQGWAHEQDNYKLVLDGGSGHVLAREQGFNTYTRIEPGSLPEAEAYWERMAPFWALVRTQWAALLRGSDVIHVKTGEEDGPLWQDMMDVAERFEDGELASDSAVQDEIKIALARVTGKRS